MNLRCRFARLHLIAGAHARVVEEQHQVARLCIQRRIRIRLERKILDGLFLVVFPDAEILGREIADIVALLVGRYHIDEHELRLSTDHRAGILRSRSLLLRARPYR